MLLLHVLLSFLLFSTCAAKSGLKGHPDGPSTSEWGFIYWWKLEFWGAKGPGSQKTYTVIPIAKVPPHLVDNRDGYVFFAEVAQYLPLEDQYKEEAKSYFREGSQFSYHQDTKVTALGNCWINTGWARIAKWDSMRRFRHQGGGRDVSMDADKIQGIYNNMLKNLDERIKAKSIKLDHDAIDLGQTFQPFIPPGSVYWLDPLFLGYKGTGAKILHPTVALGRVGYTGHDLFFLAEISTFVPGLTDTQKGEALEYFPNDEETKHFLTAEGHSRQLNIGYAQVTESFTFCFRRVGYWVSNGVRGPKNLQMKEEMVNKLFNNMQKDWAARRVTLNFGMLNLGQPNPIVVGSSETDFSLEFGRVYRITGFRNKPSHALMVVPVGPVPDSSDVFVAELSAWYDSLSGHFWESTRDYFLDKKIQTVKGFEFELWKWMINTKWAVMTPKATLITTTKSSWADVKMHDNKIKDVFDSMLANYNDRREKYKETNFSPGPPGKGQEARKVTLPGKNRPAQGGKKALQTGRNIRCMYCGSRDHSFPYCEGSDCPKLQKDQKGVWRDKFGKAYCAAFNGPRGCPSSTCRYEHACSLCPSEDHGAQSCSSTS